MTILAVNDHYYQTSPQEGRTVCRTAIDKFRDLLFCIALKNHSVGYLQNLVLLNRPSQLFYILRNFRYPQDVMTTPSS